MPVPDSLATTASLAGRTAIVTGGGSGIGQAIAMLFAEQLGVRCERVPGGHLGFSTYPEAFANRLRMILSS